MKKLYQSLFVETAAWKWHSVATSAVAQFGLREAVDTRYSLWALVFAFTRYCAVQCRYTIVIISGMTEVKAFMEWKYCPDTVSTRAASRMHLKTAYFIFAACILCTLELHISLPITNVMGLQVANIPTRLGMSTNQIFMVFYKNAA